MGTAVLNVLPVVPDVDIAQELSCFGRIIRDLKKASTLGCFLMGVFVGALLHSGRD